MGEAHRRGYLVSALRLPASPALHCMRLGLRCKGQVLYVTATPVDQPLHLVYPVTKGPPWGRAGQHIVHNECQAQYALEIPWVMLERSEKTARRLVSTHNNAMEE
jgi:hypothetical protein